MTYHESKYSVDKMIIYNYKGLEIDDVDIPYLLNEQILYVSFDGIYFLTSISIIYLHTFLF